MEPRRPTKSTNGATRPDRSARDSALAASLADAVTKAVEKGVVGGH